MKGKKGQMSSAISNLLTLGIGIMVLGIALSFGLDINDDIADDLAVCDVGTYTTYNATINMCENATGNTDAVANIAFNATSDSMTGMANITEKTPTISKVGVAVVIIGMIVAGFGVYFMKKG